MSESPSTSRTRGRETLKIYQRFKNNPLSVKMRYDETEQEWFNRINPDGKSLNGNTVRFLKGREYDDQTFIQHFHNNKALLLKRESDNQSFKEESSSKRPETPPSQPSRDSSTAAAPDPRAKCLDAELDVILDAVSRTRQYGQADKLEIDSLRQKNSELEERNVVLTGDLEAARQAPIATSRASESDTIRVYEEHIAKLKPQAERVETVEALMYMVADGIMLVDFKGKMSTIIAALERNANPKDIIDACKDVEKQLRGWEISRENHPARPYKRQRSE
ncbi:hypothetical protein VNI00_011255 [Paramarasmius palmivorus]|uniref:Uncharacterized protein n=1 Tax=Paramarasmius palmivorus TaxID=297713 RepID=A0AAW0CFE8_9AGAR